MQQTIPDIVVIAGSGRSGTTWLGSILNSYERAEYFYEICAYPELDFDDYNLMEVKYPLTSWMAKHPLWISQLERIILVQRIRFGIGRETAERSLRIHAGHRFKKYSPNVHLFKIVALFSFVIRLGELASRLSNRLKVIHIIRNPFSQLASEIRMDVRDPERSKKHFLARLEFMLQDESFSKYHDLVESYMDASWMEHMTVVWWVSNELMLEDATLHKHIVVYEDLCRDPLRKTQEIFDFLGWPLSEQTRNHITKTTNITKSEMGMFSIRKNAEEAMTRWRSEIEPEDYQRISKILEPCNLLGLWNEADLQLDTKKG